MKHETDDRKNMLAVNLSLAANVLLAVMKTFVGIVGHSPALLADGINSTSDVVYLVILHVFMRLSGSAPDREHPYGHRQLESIGAVVVGAFVVTTGVAIFWDAINMVYDVAMGQSQYGGANVLALWVALLTVIVKIFLTVFTGRIGRKTGSIAVLALTRDHRNDIFSITAAAIGIFLGRAGYVWVDPLAASIVAVVIFNTGIQILRESSADLMNILPEKAVFKRIKKLLETVPNVLEIEEVRINRIGLYLLIDVTIGVDGNLTVTVGDRIADEVERTLYKNVEYVGQVTVHYHPSQKRPAG